MNSVTHPAPTNQSQSVTVEPATRRVIEDELRYQLPLQARSHAKRNRGKAKAGYLRHMVNQTPGIIDYVLSFCQTEDPTVTADDISLVAGDILRRWSQQ